MVQDMEAVLSLILMAGCAWRERRRVVQCWLVARLRDWARGEWRQFRQQHPLDQVVLGTFIFTFLPTTILWPYISPPDPQFHIPADPVLAIFTFGWAVLVAGVGYRLVGRIIRYRPKGGARG